MPLPRVVCRVFGLLALVFGLLFCTYGVRTFAAAVGLSGAGGTLTVTDCRVDVRYNDGDRDPDDRRETRWCRGTFRAGDGSAVDPRHELQSDTAQPGDRIAVRDNGTVYLEAGLGSVVDGVLIVLIGLGMALFGGLLLVTGQYPSAWSGQHLRFQAAVRALPFGRVALWTSVAAWATAVLGFALMELFT